jgi:hypothetical protein
VLSALVSILYLVGQSLCIDGSSDTLVTAAMLPTNSEAFHEVIGTRSVKLFVIGGKHSRRDIFYCRKNIVDTKMA